MATTTHEGNGVRTRSGSSRILWYQTIGFLGIIALSWLDELINLPDLLFGGRSTSNWHEAVLETAVAVAVWIPLRISTQRLLSRLYHSEEFLRMCAWCRRLDRDGEWLPTEEYFSKGFDVHTSHSICPECEVANFPDRGRGAVAPALSE